MELAKLHEPFPADDIEWRLAQAGTTAAGDYWALALAYVTNRAIMERLDEVCGPENWRNEFKEGPGGGVLCGLSVRIDGEWVTKWDGAENTDVEAVKGGLSGAMKRAGVQWGIGRYLYNLEEGWATCHRDEKSGRFRGQTKEKSRFSWDPPALPTWALPGGSGKPDGTKAPKASAPKKESPVQKLTGEAPKGHVAPIERAENGRAVAGAACPKCGGAVWDNRTNKKNPRGPDWSCKDKEKCKWALWLDSAIGELSKEAERLAEAGAIQHASIAPLLEGVSGGDLDALRLAQDWLNTKAAEGHGRNIRESVEADDPFARAS